MKNKKIKPKRLPLKGRTILVTQAPHQAKRFSHLLKKKGAHVLQCPTIDILSYETKEMVKILKAVKEYDWLVFMSQNAVSYFFDQLKRHKISKSVLRSVKMSAIGKTTKESLKQYKLRVHLTPPVYESFELANAFKGKIEGKKFLIVSSVNGRTVLADELKRRGAVVATLSVYKTILPLENTKLLQKYLSEERIDAVTFTSPSTVENFITMLNPHGDKSIQRRLEFLTIAALGDVTSKAVESFGLRVRVQPSEFTIPSFVNTLSREL